MVLKLLKLLKANACLGVFLLSLLLLTFAPASAKGTTPPSTAPAAKPVEIIFTASSTSFNEPRTGTAYYPITVSVKDMSDLPTTVAGAIEVEVAADTDKSTATKNSDYQITAQRLLFWRGSPGKYDILLGVKSDNVADSPETLVLILKRVSGTATLTSILKLSILDPVADSRKPVYVVFKVKKDTISEPQKGTSLRAITVSVKDSSSILSTDNAKVEAEIETDAKSTAVSGQDYKWVSKPKLVFKKDGPTEYRLVLEVLSDSADDNLENLVLKITHLPDSTNSFRVNAESTYTLAIRDGEELPDVPLSVALGTNLNVLDKETTGPNVYLDVMAFQLRASQSFRWGGYVRGYQQQGTSGFIETGLGRSAGSDRLRAVYTQVAALGNNTLRVERAYKLFTPKDPTVRSSGAVLSLGYNAFNSVSATHRLQININAHLEWVKREIRVEYDEQMISRDTIEISTTSFNNSYLSLPRRDYSSIDQYSGLDFPILYQCKIGEQNLGFKIVPSIGNLMIRSDFSPTSNNFYFSTYVSITEYKHGFTLGFDTKNVLLSGESQNLGFSLFAVKMFNLSTIGNLFGFAESK